MVQFLLVYTYLSLIRDQSYDGMSVELRGSDLGEVGVQTRCPERRLRSISSFQRDLKFEKFFFVEKH
jgi:hypothetical protein